MAKIEIKLPDLGEGILEGELVNWLVKKGDQVNKGDSLVEVMTDKATVEVPSLFSGVVKELKAKPGDMVPVDAVLLVLEGDASQSEEEKKEEKESPSERPMTPENIPQNVKGMETHVLASPSTRRLAREVGVDINSLRGTGLSGRITREDVLKTSGSSLSSATTSSDSFSLGQTGDEKRVPIRGVRRRIAEQMQKTKMIVPHFSLMDECDVTPLVSLRGEMKKKGEEKGVKITYLPFVIKALIEALKKFPDFNASIDDARSEIIYKDYYHVGFAVDTSQGLLVPNVKDADKKSLVELSREIFNLAEKARNGKLSLEEMRGATCTITNIGSIGGLYATPIINHPEVAILGMYKIEDKVFSEEGKIKTKKTMGFSITCDHRLIDGAQAARFLKDFISRMGSPENLFSKEVN